MTNEFYTIVVRNKMDEVINKTDMLCQDLAEAKVFLNILMHQHGVRKGQLFKRIDDVGFATLVDESEIYHHGE